MYFTRLRIKVRDFFEVRKMTFNIVPVNFDNEGLKTVSCTVQKERAHLHLLHVVSLGRLNHLIHKEWSQKC